MLTPNNTPSVNKPVPRLFPKKSYSTSFGDIKPETGPLHSALDRVKRTSTLPKVLSGSEGLSPPACPPSTPVVPSIEVTPPTPTVPETLRIPAFAIAPAELTASELELTSPTSTAAAFDYRRKKRMEMQAVMEDAIDLIGHTDEAGPWGSARPLEIAKTFEGMAPVIEADAIAEAQAEDAAAKKSPSRLRRGARVFGGWWKVTKKGSERK